MATPPDDPRDDDHQWPVYEPPTGDRSSDLGPAAYGAPSDPYDAREDGPAPGRGGYGASDYGASGYGASGYGTDNRRNPYGQTPPNRYGMRPYDRGERRGIPWVPWAAVAFVVLLLGQWRGSFIGLFVVLAIAWFIISKYRR